KGDSRSAFSIIMANHTVLCKQGRSIRRRLPHPPRDDNKAGEDKRGHDARTALPQKHSPALRSFTRIKSLLLWKLLMLHAFWVIQTHFKYRAKEHLSNPRRVACRGYSAALRTRLEPAHN